jgi:hypothetical protein
MGKQSVTNACRHIVAAQVYGEKAADGKGENKWIASSIDLLMQRFPTFRVAYMDKVMDHPIAKKNGVTHSVLLRWNRDLDKPEELYRVRLPWQLEDKRGVVRPCPLKSVPLPLLPVTVDNNTDGGGQLCIEGAWLAA